jgi:glycosyltransferase involved in cell wall biosynthesis
MLISVVTVCWNAAASIGPTLTSVQAQTHPAIEQVIVDGASTDGTLDLVRQLAPGAVIISEPDRGIYDAMNKGAAAAQGELIYFLNAGDLLVDPDALADVARFFEAHPEIDVAYGGLKVVDLDGSSHDHLPPPADQAGEELIRGCLPHKATFARRRVFELTGGFDLRYRIHSDHDWFVKVAFDPLIRLARIERTIAAFQLGGASSRLEDSQPEFYAILDQVPAYQTETWMRRRIDILQQSLLQSRIEADGLRAKLRSPPPTGVAAPTVAAAPAPGRSIHDIWSRKLERVRDRRA